MSTSFPTGLDTLTNPTATDKVAVVSHSSQHANANDAIEALQAKVGANSSAVTTSHDYKLGEVTGTDQAVGKTATQTLTNKTLTSPTINNAVMTTPTGITATDVGLGSVTNDAQLKRAAGDLNTFTQKVAPEAADILVIEDSSASYAKKKVLASTFGVGSPGQFLRNFTAKTNLTVGQPVGVTSLVNSYVSASMLSTNSATHSIPNTSSVVLRQKNTCAIGGDKFVSITDSTDSSGTLYAQVGSINTSTNVLTLGTAAVVATTITPYVITSLQNACICKLDTDKFIVFYLLDASTTVIKYRVGTVSGTTITFGTEATATTAASTLTTSSAFISETIGTDKGVFVYKAGTSANSRMLAFTVSGTVATFGTPVALGAVNQIFTSVEAIRKIDTDKFVLVTANDPNIYSQVGTISGTTITLGSEVTTSVTSVNSNVAITIISPATDVYIVSTGITAGGNSNNIVAFTVSGTVPTPGTGLVVSTGISSTIVFKDTTTSYLFDGSNNDVKIITRSGTTLTLSSTSIKEFTSANFDTCLLLDNNYPIAIKESATTVTVWIYGMSNNFIGFAQSTVSAGQQVAVAISGADTNQTGLTAGAAYSPSGGLLTVADNSFTSNTVKAISDTIVIF